VLHLSLSVKDCLKFVEPPQAGLKIDGMFKLNYYKQKIPATAGSDLFIQ